MIVSTIKLTAVIIGLSALVSAVNQRSIMFQVIQKGQVPINGTKQLQKFHAASKIGCARECWNNGDNSGCGGFVYQPDSCTSNNGSPSQSGVCQTLNFTDPDSLLYGPALSTCDEFCVPQQTVITPSKRYKWAIQQGSLFSFILSCSWVPSRVNTTVNRTKDLLWLSSLIKKVAPFRGVLDKLVELWGFRVWSTSQLGHALHL
jgi:hypothetical protein